MDMIDWQTATTFMAADQSGNSTVIKDGQANEPVGIDVLVLGSGAVKYDFRRVDRLIK